MIGLRRETFRNSIRKQQLTESFSKKRNQTIKSFDCFKLEEDAQMLLYSIENDEPQVSLSITMDYLEKSQSKNNLILGLQALNGLFYKYDTKDLDCLEILLKYYQIAKKEALKCINNFLVDNMHLADQLLDLVVVYDPELKEEITQFIWIISEAVDNLQLLDYLEILEKSIMEELYGPRQEELVALNTILEQLGKNNALEEFIERKEELIKTILKYQIQVIDGYIINEINYIDCLSTLVEYTNQNQINQLYFYGFESLVNSMFLKLNEWSIQLMNLLELFTSKQSILLNSYVLFQIYQIVQSKEQYIFEFLMRNYNKQTLSIICNSIAHDKVCKMFLANNLISPQLLMVLQDQISNNYVEKKLVLELLYNILQCDGLNQKELQYISSRLLFLGLDYMRCDDSELNEMLDIKVNTSLNQKVAIVGNHPLLGQWNAAMAMVLQTDESIFPFWQNTQLVSVPRGSKLEFKFVIISDTVIWETLPQNRKYRAKHCVVVLTAEWNDYNGKEFIQKKFQSSQSLDIDILKDFKKTRLSQKFDPFEQAESDSDESNCDSFKKWLNPLEEESDSDQDKRKKVQVNLSKNIDFPSLYIANLDQPKLRQLKSFSQNDILYEVNDDHLISVDDDEMLIVASFYLPIIIKNNQVSLFKHSFSYHLQAALSTLKCQKKWIGIPIIYDEFGRRIYELSQEMTDYLLSINYIPVKIKQDTLNYFNEFCTKLYQPIMNNDVSLSKLAAFEYEDKMWDTFQDVNNAFFTTLHNQNQTMVLINDYRLIYLATLLAKSDPRLALSIFYNRMFPYQENLKLIPFYKEILNSFLLCNIICFSSYDTANQFMKTMKENYNLQYQSVKGNITFVYLGREIYIKIQNPGVQLSLCDIQDVEKTNDLIIVAVDIYGHQSGVELKLRHLYKFVKETNLITPNIKFYQIIQKPIEDGNSNEQKRNTIISQIQQINNYLYPNQENFFIKLVEDDDQTVRQKLFKQAKIYLQTRYSGRHDFYLLEYMHINPFPIVLISDSSCYHKGCTSLFTFNVFSSKDFKENFQLILQKVIGNEYHKNTFGMQVQKDKQTIYNGQTSTWIEKIYLECKKVSMMTKYAQISLTYNEGLLNKVAHNHNFSQIDQKKLKKNFDSSLDRVLIFDYELLISNQTFVDFKPSRIINQSPHGKKEDHPILIRQVNPDIMSALKQLSKICVIYVVSNENHNELNLAFKGTDINLFAENGFLFKYNQADWQQLIPIDVQAISQVHKVFQQFAQKTEGAHIDLRESSITWSIKQADEIAQLQISDLKENVQQIVERYQEFEMKVKDNQIEVCPANLNKALIVDLILQKESLKGQKLDFVLLGGRGSQDEQMFSEFIKIKQFNKNYFTDVFLQIQLFYQNSYLYSVSLGLVPTLASHYIQDKKELLQILNYLI